MFNNTSLIVILLVLVGVVVYMCVSRDESSEGYWSLPFAGGDIRTYAPDPHRIEGKLGRAMDETDMSGGYPL